MEEPIYNVPGIIDCVLSIILQDIIDEGPIYNYGLRVTLCARSINLGILDALFVGITSLLCSPNSDLSSWKFSQTNRNS